MISTHGRSFWVMYNIAPLRQLNAQIAEAEVHLFDPVDAVRSVADSAMVFYYLKEAVDTLTLDFLDAEGNVTRTFTGTSDDEPEEPAPTSGSFDSDTLERKPSTKAGSHSFRWDLRYAGYTDFEGRIFWAASNRGPMAVPGRYQVRLTAGNVSRSQEFEVQLDPRLRGTVTVAQLQERFDLALQIRDRVSAANQAVIQIRDIKAAVDDRLQQTDDRGIERQGATVKEKLSAVEQEIYQVKNQSNQDPLNFPIKLNNKLAALMGTVESAEAAPTDQSQRVFQHLSNLLQAELDRLTMVLRIDLHGLNELLRAANLEPIEADQKEMADGG